jgi:hypothetical protein
MKTAFTTMALLTAAGCGSAGSGSPGEPSDLQLGPSATPRPETDRSVVADSGASQVELVEHVGSSGTSASTYDYRQPPVSVDGQLRPADPRPEHRGLDSRTTPPSEDITHADGITHTADFLTVAEWTQWAQPGGYCAQEPGVFNTCNQSNVYQYFQWQGSNIRGADNNFVGFDRPQSCSLLQEGYSTSFQYYSSTGYLYASGYTGGGVVFDTAHACSDSNGIILAGVEQFSFDWGWGSNPYPYVPGNGWVQPYAPAQPGYVMDLYANYAQNYQPVDIAPINHTSAQSWYMNYNYTYGTWEFELGRDHSWCLDKPGGENANGTRLQLYQCNHGRNQNWTFVSTAGQSEIGQLVNLESGTCLDTPVLNFNNPTLQVWACHGNLNQEWFL